MKSKQQFATVRELFARIGWGAVCLLLIVSSGCSSHDDWKARTYPASGMIKVNGIAPEHAMLMFHPLGEPVDQRKSVPWGIVKADGQYDVSTYVNGDGAPIGEYAVTLYWPVNPHGPSPDRLKGRYANLEAPIVTVSIGNTGNDLPPIELTNVSVLPAAKFDPITGEANTVP